MLRGGGEREEEQEGEALPKCMLVSREEGGRERESGRSLAQLGNNASREGREGEG